MKTFLISGLLFGLQCGALSQGTVNFNNRVPGSVVAPIYGSNPSAPFVQLQGNATTNGGSVDYTGYPLLSGTGWAAALWGSPAGLNGFQELATTTFRTSSSFAGFIQPISSVTVPWVMFNNTPVDFQVRVWDNVNGTIGTWSQVLADPTVPRSVSATFTVNVPLAGGTPADLVGMTSFNIPAAPVPEPSLLALGGIAISLLLWRTLRQRRSSDGAA